jgi:putative spermidine/putrescine transport system permease protein
MASRSYLGLLLLLPAILLVAVTVIYPFILILSNSVLNSTAPAILPQTTEQIARWQPGTPIDPALHSALTDDLLNANKSRILSRAALVLENEQYGLRELLTRTGNRLREQADQGQHPDILAAATEWADEKWWRALKRGLSPYTLTHLLHVTDFYYDRQGQLAAVPDNQAIFMPALQRTLVISVLVTLLCLVLAYPIAWVLSSGSRRWQSFMLICVLLPFWTSLLVRTSAWIVLLQRQGVLNDALLALGMSSERLQLIYNRTGVLTAMVHILLPFMILPVYAAMNNIPGFQLRAGLSLGASPMTVFRRVLFPQTVPGLRTGSIIVFVMALGFYITPALVGSPSDQMIAGFISIYLNERLDWGTASSLAILLSSTMALGYLVIHLTGKVLQR